MLLSLLVMSYIELLSLSSNFTSYLGTHGSEQAGRKWSTHNRNTDRKCYSNKITRTCSVCMYLDNFISTGYCPTYTVHFINLGMYYIICLLSFQISNLDFFFFSFRCWCLKEGKQGEATLQHWSHTSPWLRSSLRLFSRVREDKLTTLWLSFFPWLKKILFVSKNL